MGLLLPADCREGVERSVGGMRGGSHCGGVGEWAGHQRMKELRKITGDKLSQAAIGLVEGSYKMLRENGQLSKYVILDAKSPAHGLS